MVTKPTIVASAWFDSPLGGLRLDTTQAGLCRVILGTQRTPADRVRGTHPVLRDAIAELRAFFAGCARPSEVPLDLAVGTPFERTVWTTLMRTVLPGELITYGELAARSGRPKAARAVGAAMGRNPVPLFVPCHRVVAAGARPGGFGPGLDVKQALLSYEGTVLPGFRASSRAADLPMQTAAQ